MIVKAGQARIRHLKQASNGTRFKQAGDDVVVGAPPTTKVAPLSDRINDCTRAGAGTDTDGHKMMPRVAIAVGFFPLVSSLAVPCVVSCPKGGANLSRRYLFSGNWLTAAALACN
ncbi:hypothetical protein FVEG_15617 [Fusarium verticillioides 7600]|uniref:Uncharacterized protein n=1 Tax=Gibberella moniliformis (strain M3125 / FGSC 7600) TaxID=334819 RepID=W7M9B9_GIBM7|nr:hypothetical protein FVEG_15617 [Fusarium verticillioides 7600]EWG44175.1 hypothetical protein FVEG_15617 [Fusarium verticillioides 7600]